MLCHHQVADKSYKFFSFFDADGAAISTDKIRAENVAKYLHTRTMM